MHNQSHYSAYLRALPKEPAFPKNLLRLRRNTGLRVISLCLFLLCTVNFINMMTKTTFRKSDIRAEQVTQREHRGWIKRFCEWLYCWAWQGAPEKQKIDIDVQHQISSERFWSFVQLALAWCFVWMCFDWEKAKHFVFAGIAIGMGIVYTLMPLDSMPDFIPVAGVIDDLTMNIFGTSLGIASILEYYRKKRQESLVARLINSNPDAAITVALEDYNLTLEGAQQSPPAYPEGRADAPSGSAEAGRWLDKRL